MYNSSTLTLTTMDIDTLSQKLKSALATWHQSQKNQTSGYDYEKSFADLWTKLGQAVFQESLGDNQYQKHKKKK